VSPSSPAMCPAALVRRPPQAPTIGQQEGCLRRPQEGDIGKAPVALRSRAGAVMLKPVLIKFHRDLPIPQLVLPDSARS